MPKNKEYHLYESDQGIKLSVTSTEFDLFPVDGV